MHVQLIEYTPNPEKVVAAAARLCYSPLSANEIMDGLNEQMVESFLQKLTDMGCLLYTSRYQEANRQYLKLGRVKSW